MAMVTPGTGPKTPAGIIAVGAGALLFAAVLVVVGLRESRMTCTPASCVTVTSWPSSRDELALASVTAVEVRESSGKQRAWKVALIGARGASIPLRSAPDAAAAEALKVELEALLAGQRETVERASSPNYWALVFAALLAVFGVYEIADGLRRRKLYVGPPRAASAEHRPRGLWLWLGLAAAAVTVGAIGNFVLARSLAGSTGVLRLECRHRCEFGGMTCLPGGVTEMSLNPGEYTVKVWNPAAPDSWEPRKVTLEIGQTSRFVCEPGG